MKRKILLLLTLIASASAGLYAQNVGVGIAAPTQKLHVADGVSPNTATIRVSGLSSTTALAAGTAPFSVVIVDANGVMYRGGTVGAGNRDAWYTIGNAGTTAGTNFIGTLDNQAFVIKTNGAAATNERMRVLATGAGVYNNTTPFAGDVFSVYGSGYTGAINALGNFAFSGYVGGNGVGVYGESNSATTNTGYGVWGNLIAANTPTTFASIGVFGSNNAVPQGTGVSYGVLGQATSTTLDARGVEGVSASVSGIGTTGFATAAAVGTNTAHGVYGQVNGTITTGFAMGVRGVVNATTGANAYGVYGQSASIAGTAVIGFANTSAGAITTAAYGMYGQVNGTVGAGGAAIGVRGLTAATVTTGTAYGIYGNTASTNGIGVIGFSTSATNTFSGVQGQNGGLGDGVRGFNTLATPATAGAGGYFQTNATTSGGAEGYNLHTDGTGGIFGGDGVGALTYLGAGSGSSSSGLNAGAVGWATSNTVNTLRYGGYFDANAGTSFAYVGCITAANVNRKIEGNGTVNTTVKDINNNMVVLSCPEAPENLFQDYGQGKLVNGKAHITLDPTLSKNIVVNPKHPLRVFIQLEGDSKGVYVTNKTQYGFDVVELDGGTSNIDFTWSVVANRADEQNADGSWAKYSEERFAPAIGAQKGFKTKSLENKVPNMPIQDEKTDASKLPVLQPGNITTPEKSKSNQ
jgi:hypothetical protein